MGCCGVSKSFFPEGTAFVSIGKYSELQGSGYPAHAVRQQQSSGPAGSKQGTGFRSSRKLSPKGCTNVGLGPDGSRVTVGNKTIFRILHVFYSEEGSTVLTGLKVTQNIFERMYSKLRRPILHLAFMSALFPWQEGLFLQSPTECCTYTPLIVPHGRCPALGFSSLFLFKVNPAPHVQLKGQVCCVLVLFHHLPWLCEMKN